MTSGPLLVQIAVRIGGLALVAVGGVNALIPALHDGAVGATGWMSDASFAEAVGLSQVAPGPNMLLVPLIGWQTAGLAGALVALGAFLVPSCVIAILGSRLLGRYAGSAPVAALRWALRPVTGGLMVSSGLVIVQSAARTLPDASAAASLGLAGIAVVVALGSMLTKWNPLVWLAAAALLGGVIF